MDCLVGGLSPRANKLRDKFIAVVSMKTRGMESYLDESGIDQDTGVCVLAGFAGGYQQWRRLQPKWDEVVKVLPNLDFHAHTFFQRENGKRIGPYKEWSDDRAAEFLDALIDAIQSVALHPIGAGVEYSAFNKRTLDERIFLTGGIKSEKKWLTSGSPDRPYYLGFQHCITDAIEYAQHSHIKVNFFCDTQKQLAPYAHDLYARYKTRHPRRLAHCGELSYVSRVSIRVVQAADLLSYVAYRHGVNPTEETDYALLRLLEKENELRFYNDEGIDKALHNYSTPKLTMGEMNPQAAKREQKRRERLGISPATVSKT
jgi:hypothetical protein